jgi:hypothetical protein
VGAAAEEVRALSRGLGEDASRLTARYDKLGDEGHRRGARGGRGDAPGERRRRAHLAARGALLASGDVELRVTAQELRATADSLGAVARRLNDPRTVLWGPPEGGQDGRAVRLWVSF